MEVGSDRPSKIEAPNTSGREEEFHIVAETPSICIMTQAHNMMTVHTMKSRGEPFWNGERTNISIPYTTQWYEHNAA